MEYDDIYFSPLYGKLNEEIEHAESVTVEFKCQYGKVSTMFMKRKIPTQVDGMQFYDIITPYGYGGPIIGEYTDKLKLLLAFRDHMEHFTKENRIVSEFVRFHPLLNNAADFTDLYDVKNIRSTVATNLKDYDDPFSEEFSKSCRKNIKKALDKGVTYRIIENPENSDSFYAIYKSTMDRNSAEEYYYFGEDYFALALKLFRQNILLVEAIYEEKVIACGFYFVYGNFVHTHLSGTLTEYLYLSPAYILRYALTLWAKARGYQYIHHGGGRTNSVEDSLYLFKKQFSKNTAFDFCIGKKIWMPDVYEILCRDIDRNGDFFPEYRGGK